MRKQVADLPDHTAMDFGIVRGKLDNGFISFHAGKVSHPARRFKQFTGRL
jgi:hypothetical protein